MRAFLIRAAVAAVAIPALLAVFYQGGWWLRGLVAILTALGCLEARQLAGQVGAAFNYPLAAVCTLLSPWVAFPQAAGDAWILWLVLVIVAAAAPAVWKQSPKAAGAGAAAQIVTVIWVGIGLGALVALRGLGSVTGYRWLLFLFANLWIGDTAAYLFGVWLGKTKLSPAISPNKTVVGAVTQVLTSLLLGLVFVAGRWIDAPALLLLLASLAIAVIGQIGDLAESILKRIAGQKDSGTILPGHGGILDRFDSTLLAAPTLWAMIRLWSP
ncbi:MAG: phosphatidate cytidylyltransferase [candidate division Zixibacteria bacterium]|nr:phosphatidate cytidylyltransferase [candidate division Zixibacteria bacterium]